MNSQSNYLIADAEHPLISTDKVRDELLLYNIPARSTAELFRLYYDLTGKRIDADHSLRSLSGGQKVLLMALLALQSPTERIRFINLERSLDEHRREAIMQMILASDKLISLEKHDA